MPGIDEPFRTLFCDPGEDFGWCMGRGTKLIAGGTEKMWTFADDIWDALIENDGWLIDPIAGGCLRDEASDEENRPPEECKIGRVVCEDFRIYPNKYRELAWNPVRTARVIGAITIICHRVEIPLIFQPAAIKKAAMAAGAEELFWHPTHENRHQNDAAMHYVYYTCTELLGLHMPVKTENPEGL
jgi:hypothetical protein